MKMRNEFFIYFFGSNLIDEYEIKYVCMFII
jgi:hypothetical protein